MIYASRTAESLNSDPAPEVNPDGTRAAIGEGRPTYEPGPFGKLVEPVRYDPRPSFTPKTTHPANPILVEFRREVEAGYSAAKLAMMWLDDGFLLSDVEALPRQNDHAKRVLRRLASFHA